MRFLALRNTCKSGRKPKAKPKSYAARPARAAQGYNDGLSSESAAASEPRPQLSQEAAAAASFDKSELAPVTNQLLQEARAPVLSSAFGWRGRYFAYDSPDLTVRHGS